MGKLHELLAVEGDLKNTANKILVETAETFKKRKHLFTGHVKTYFPSVEGGESFEPEEKKVEYTIDERLKYTLQHLGRFMDANFQKEMANTEATGDITLAQGKILLVEKVPVTMLLALEKYLGLLFSVYQTIPTLEPGKDWQVDKKQVDIFVAKDKPVYKTAKKTTPVVLYEATKEHPAQVKEVVEDERVGHTETMLYSACITPKRKSEYLGRIQELIGAIKKARSRANNQEVKKNQIADKLFDHITAL